MHIKIDIDVSPQELRTFLGLPDLSGLQDDMLRYARERLMQGGEGFDPSALMREAIRGSAHAWQQWLAAANRAREAGTGDEPDAHAGTEASEKTGERPAQKTSSRTTQRGRAAKPDND